MMMKLSPTTTTVSLVVLLPLLPSLLSSRCTTTTTLAFEAGRRAPAFRRTCTSTLSTRPFLLADGVPQPQTSFCNDNGDDKDDVMQRRHQQQQHCDVNQFAAAAALGITALAAGGAAFQNLDDSIIPELTAQLSQLEQSLHALLSTTKPSTALSEMLVKQQLPQQLETLQSLLASAQTAAAWKEATVSSLQATTELSTAAMMAQLESVTNSLLQRLETLEVVIRTQVAVSQQQQTAVANQWVELQTSFIAARDALLEFQRESLFPALQAARSAAADGVRAAVHTPMFIIPAEQHTETARLLLMASAETTASCQPATRSKNAVAPVVVARWMVPSQQQSQSHQEESAVAPLSNRSPKKNAVAPVVVARWMVPPADANNKLFHGDGDDLLQNTSLEARLSAALMQGKTVEETLLLAGDDEVVVESPSSLPVSSSALADPDDGDAKNNELTSSIQMQEPVVAEAVDSLLSSQVNSSALVAGLYGDNDDSAKNNELGSIIQLQAETAVAEAVDSLLAQVDSALAELDGDYAKNDELLGSIIIQTPEEETTAVAEAVDSLLAQVNSSALAPGLDDYDDANKNELHGSSSILQSQETTTTVEEEAALPSTTRTTAAEKASQNPPAADGKRATAVTNFGRSVVQKQQQRQQQQSFSEDSNSNHQYGAPIMEAATAQFRAAEAVAAVARSVMMVQQQQQSPPPTSNHVDDDDDLPDVSLDDEDDGASAAAQLRSVSSPETTVQQEVVDLEFGSGAAFAGLDGDGANEPSSIRLQETVQDAVESSSQVSSSGGGALIAGPYDAGNNAAPEDDLGLLQLDVLFRDMESMLLATTSIQQEETLTLTAAPETTATTTPVSVESLHQEENTMLDAYTRALAATVAADPSFQALEQSLPGYTATVTAVMAERATESSSSTFLSSQQWQQKQQVVRTQELLFQLKTTLNARLDSLLLSQEQQQQPSPHQEPSDQLYQQLTDAVNQLQVLTATPPQRADGATITATNHESSTQEALQFLAQSAHEKLAAVAATSKVALAAPQLSSSSMDSSAAAAGNDVVVAAVPASSVASSSSTTTSTTVAMNTDDVAPDDNAATTTTMVGQPTAKAVVEAAAMHEDDDDSAAAADVLEQPLPPVEVMESIQQAVFGNNDKQKSYSNKKHNQEEQQRFNIHP